MKLINVCCGTGPSLQQPSGLSTFSRAASLFLCLSRSSSLHAKRDNHENYAYDLLPLPPSPPVRLAHPIAAYGDSGTHTHPCPCRPVATKQSDRPKAESVYARANKHHAAQRDGQAGSRGWRVAPERLWRLVGAKLATHGGGGA